MVEQAACCSFLHLLRILLSESIQKWRDLGLLQILESGDIFFCKTLLFSFLPESDHGSDNNPSACISEPLTILTSMFSPSPPFFSGCTSGISVLSKEKAEQLKKPIILLEHSKAIRALDEHT